MTNSVKPKFISTTSRLTMGNLTYYLDEITLYHPPCSQADTQREGESTERKRAQTDRQTDTETDRQRGGEKRERRRKT